MTTYLSGHFGESSVSVEALQEFKIQTSGMSAEFGRAHGGVFNYVMKSGANEIQGSAYGALRNEAFDANTAVNKFNNRPRGLDRRQNYAFSGGAPIYIPKIYNGKNRTFFFADYEGTRQRSASVFTTTVPLFDVAFVPSDARVTEAAWNGTAVARGPFTRVVSSLADKVLTQCRRSVTDDEMDIAS